MLNSDGSFTYTPNSGFSGTDTFTYKANDGQTDSNNPATVTIKVNQKHSVYGAYPYPGTYYSACSCYATPAKSQSVYAYGLEVSSKAGSNTRVDYYYDQNQGKVVFQSSQQAPNYDEGSYSLFLRQVQLPNPGFWQVVAVDPDNNNGQDSK